MLKLLSYKVNEAKILENRLNPVMLVFMGKLLLNTVRGVPVCQSFSHFSVFFLHYFVLAKIATCSIRVNGHNAINQFDN